MIQYRYAVANDKMLTGCIPSGIDLVRERAGFRLILSTSDEKWEQQGAGTQSLIIVIFRSATVSDSMSHQGVDPFVP